MTIWRWVQYYAPILNRRLRKERRHPNRSWRVDETYVKVAGRWTYLYRAVDSAGETTRFHAVPEARSDGSETISPVGAVRGLWPPATGDQCGWTPGLRPRHRRIETVGGTGAPLSLPAVALPQQRDRAGPPIHQETHRGESLVPIGRRSHTDNRRVRGHASNPQRANPMGSEGQRKGNSFMACSVSLPNFKGKIRTASMPAAICNRSDREPDAGEIAPAEPRVLENGCCGLHPRRRNEPYLNRAWTAIQMIPCPASWPRWARQGPSNSLIASAAP